VDRTVTLTPNLTHCGQVDAAMTAASTVCYFTRSLRSADPRSAFYRRSVRRRFVGVSVRARTAPNRVFFSIDFICAVVRLYSRQCMAAEQSRTQLAADARTITAKFHLARHVTRHAPYLARAFWHREKSWRVLRRAYWAHARHDKRDTHDTCYWAYVHAAYVSNSI